MATEAVVSFAVERFGDMLIQEAIFLKGVRGKVERLNKDVGAMKCFLEEAEKKQEEDLRVRKWVSEIRDAVYDVEDIIDIHPEGRVPENRLLSQACLQEVDKPP